MYTHTRTSTRTHTHTHTHSHTHTQEQCFRESCNFDGGDCYARPNMTNPWVNCSLASTCIPLYRNGQCDVKCNTPDCLYDGLDCIPSVDISCPIAMTCAERVGDGMCSNECNTAECPYDAIDCQGDEFVSAAIVSRHLCSYKVKGARSSRGRELCSGCYGGGSG